MVESAVGARSVRKDYGAEEEPCVWIVTWMDSWASKKSNGWAKGIGGPRLA